MLNSSQKTRRRGTVRTRSAVAIAATALVATINAAHAYPSEPVELVVSYAAGGVSDLMARSFAQAVERSLKTTMVVQNRPGAAGIIGTSYVHNAKADGHTLLLARIAVLAVAPALQKVPYDPDSFTYVGLIATDPYACVTSTRKPYKTLDDLKQAIKKSQDRSPTVPQEWGLLTSSVRCACSRHWTSVMQPKSLYTSPVQVKGRHLLLSRAATWISSAATSLPSCHKSKAGRCAACL